MHVILRRFAGAAAQAEEATRRAQQGLVPLLKKQQGFLGYAALASEQGDFVTFSIYEDAAAARRASEEVRGWARECGVLPQTSTETFRGAVWRHALVEPKSGGADQSLYCMIRETENAPADERSWALWPASSAPSSGRTPGSAASTCCAAPRTPPGWPTSSSAGSARAP